ncbi:MAG: hypothetical protein JW951_07425, partial [Lentisphaerae bacterium]|nr:hypothetical protein [Lentisphaerota bacterium]
MIRRKRTAAVKHQTRPARPVTRLLLACLLCGIAALRGFTQDGGSGTSPRAAVPLSLQGWHIQDSAGTVEAPAEGFLSLSYRSPDGAPV